MFKKGLIITSLVLIVSPAGQAVAQGIYIGPQVGYYKVQDADEGNFIGGVTIRFKSKSNFGLEASINYRKEKYANDALTVRSWPVMVTGLFYPLPIVYGAMGAGWYNTTFDYDKNKLPFFKDKTSQEFGWHFGAGLEIPVGKNSKLIADIRYVFLNYNFGKVPGSSDLSSNFFIITTGYLFEL
jgi:opacity protein-like surface antigen